MDICQWTGCFHSTCVRSHDATPSFVLMAMIVVVGARRASLRGDRIQPPNTLSGAVCTRQLADLHMVYAAFWRFARVIEICLKPTASNARRVNAVAPRLAAC